MKIVLNLRNVVSSFNGLCAGVHPEGIPELEVLNIAGSAGHIHHNKHAAVIN